MAASRSSTVCIESMAVSMRDQALVAWSLVHGLTTLLIDPREFPWGLGEAEQYARQAGMALFEGLRAKTT